MNNKYQVLSKRGMMTALLALMACGGSASAGDEQTGDNSSVDANGQVVSLRDVIDGNQSALLGDAVAERFGELPFLFKTCAELRLEEKCPEILEVLDMINPDEIPERFTPEQLGQFQIGFFHQESKWFKDKESATEK